MSIEAMKQALEALESINEISKPPMNIPLAAEIDGAMDALRKAIEQAERKPVKSFSGGVPWYATDAPKHEDDDTQEYKKPWVGLTDEEIDYLEDAIDPAMYRVFARRIEAKLKEKNHD
jgi:hypothetical protein